MLDFRQMQFATIIYFCVAWFSIAGAIEDHTVS